jgi:hypothetical protein
MVSRSSRAVFVGLAIFACGACAPATRSADAPSITSASRVATTTALQRAFRAPQVDAGWFAPSLLAEISLDQLQATFDLIRATMGDYQGAVGSGDDYLVRFSAGQRSVRAKLDEEGRFVVFVVGPG